MGELRRRTSIAAHRGRIYRFVADPHNAPEYIGSISRVEAGAQAPIAEGQVWRAQASFLGQPRSIRLRLDRLEPDRLVRFTLQGEPQAAIEIGLVARSREGRDETEVSLLLDVPSVPGLLLAGMMGGLLSADLARLKRIMESS